MYNHAPQDYPCPFCSVAQGTYIAYTQPQDVIYRDSLATAFIASHFWENNKGHAIIIPNEHYENIYDLPDDLGAHIHRTSRQIALALKETYRCHGISTRQHNEPGANQDVWHYHLHVFPRYEGDNLYLMHRRPATPEERLPYAQKLRHYLNNFLY